MPKTVPTKQSLKTIATAKLLVIKQWLIFQGERLGNWAQQNWFRLLIIGLLTFILLRKDVRFELELQNASVFTEQDQVKNVALLTRNEESKDNSASTSTPPLSAKRKKQVAYVKRFAKVAQTEMVQFGIPASITLAQGLLETNAGESPLATKHNNHFGMKCFSRTCTKGHCSNFSDDSHKDFFRRFDSAWESFRAHSLLLSKGERYLSLFKLPRTDYAAWAKGLKKAGYATDGAYAEKLVSLIEELGLDGYDG